MNKFNSLLATAVMAVVMASPAQADWVVNTGVPTSTTFSSALDSTEWLAAEFTTSKNVEIDRIQGYIAGQDNYQAGNTFTVAIYGDTAAGKVDLSNELFSQQATFNGDGWNGLTGLTFNLAAGTYWVGFEVVSRDPTQTMVPSDTLSGLMPGTAPVALQTASQDPTGNFGYVNTTGNSYHYGVRISAVPEPATLMLFAPGLLLLGRYAKRKAA